MNCKPGDLAVVISDGPFLGKIIRTTKLIHEWGYPAWEFEDSPIPVSGMLQVCFFDRVLRPLRDSDGADETLTWKAIPSPKVTA